MRTFQVASFLLCGLLATPAFAADPEEGGAEQGTGEREAETLLGGNFDVGGFGAPVLKVTSVHGDAALLVGGRGGAIFGDAFWIGGGGMGLANRIDIRLPGEINRRTSFSYGGPMLGFVFLSDELIHGEVAALVGGGALRLSDTRDDIEGPDGEVEFDDDTRSDAFFVVEPEVNVELNVTSFFRIGAGLSYRFVNGIETGNLDDGDFSGVAGTLLLKFGSF